jgi:hypothetical protein
MSTILRRRLERIEAAVMPQPEQAFAVLFEPGADATANDSQAHQDSLQAARASGARVVIVRTVNAPLRPIDECGCLIVGSELEAQLAVLAGKRSERNNKSRLADVLEDLPGTVMGTITAHLPPERKRW